MIQQRKKDYLQRLIEEFFKKLQKAVNGSVTLNNSEKETLLKECFDFFTENFEILKSDKIEHVINKIPDNDLLEQYAELLTVNYDLSDKGGKQDLLNALHIVEYLQDADDTYSWSRVVLREDILHRLDSL